MTTILLWYAANVYLVWTIYWILTSFAAWWCLTTQTGIERLTWLVAIIFLPVAGIAFYGIHEWSKPLDSKTDGTTPKRFL